MFIEIQSCKTGKLNAIKPSNLNFQMSLTSICDGGEQGGTRNLTASLSYASYVPILSCGICEVFKFEVGQIFILHQMKKLCRNIRIG